MRINRMKTEVINQINQIGHYIKNEELEKAKEVISSLEETIINNYENSPLKKQIELYKKQIKQKEATYK